MDTLFKFKSKDKYEKKTLNRLKKNVKRKIYINSFCLKSYFSLALADEEMVREWNKIKVVKKYDATVFCRYDDIRRESKAFSIATWTKRKRMNTLPNIYNWCDFL